MTEKLLDRQLSLKPFEHHKISLPWYQEGTQRHRSGMLHSDSQFPTIKKNKQQDTRTLMPHTAGTKLENRETETQEFWMQHGPVRLKKTKPHYCIYGVLRQLGKKKNACTSFLRSCMSAMKCFAEKSPKVFEQMYSNYLMAEKQQLNAVFFSFQFCMSLYSWVFPKKLWFFPCTAQIPWRCLQKIDHFKKENASYYLRPSCHHTLKKKKYLELVKLSQNVQGESKCNSH